MLINHHDINRRDPNPHQQDIIMRMYSFLYQYREVIITQNKETATLAGSELF